MYASNPQPIIPPETVMVTAETSIRTILTFIYQLRTLTPGKAAGVDNVLAVPTPVSHISGCPQSCASGSTQT
jgi:sulfite reductase beta subunit-like hemoprotein